MRPDVKLGVVISMVVVLVAGLYYVYTDSRPEAVPASSDRGGPGMAQRKPTPSQLHTVPGTTRTVEVKPSAPRPAAPAEPAHSSRGKQRSADRAPRQGKLAERSTPKGPVRRPAAPKPRTVTDVVAQADGGPRKRPATKPRRKVPAHAARPTALAATKPPTTGGAEQKTMPQRRTAVETHRVQPGDTLSALAQRYYGSAGFTRFLIESNPHIADPNRLAVGMAVRIPPPPADVAKRKPSPRKSMPAKGHRTYTVKRGDSFYAIARDVLGDAGRWKELFELNKEAVAGDATRLQVGQVILLPNP